MRFPNQKKLIARISLDFFILYRLFWAFTNGIVDN